MLVLAAGPVLLTGCRLGSFADINNGSGDDGSDDGGADPTTTFTTPINLTTDSNGADAFIHRDDFLIDGLGTLHLMYEEVDSTGGRQVKYLKKVSGGSFETPLTLSEASSVTGFVTAGTARIAVSSGGVVHVVWQEGDISPAGRIFYTSDRSGAFVDPIELSPDALAATGPEIVVDTLGDAHIVFNHAATVAEVLYVGVFTGSVQTATVVSDQVDPGGVRPGSLAVDRTSSPGAIAVLWVSSPSGANARALSRERTAGIGGTFGSIVDLSVLPGGGHGIAGDFDANLDVEFDSQGNLHVTFVHFTAGIGKVMRNVRLLSGTFRAEAQEVSDSSTMDNSNYVMRLDSSGNMFVFWEEVPTTGSTRFVLKDFAPGDDPADVTALEIDVSPGTLEHRLLVEVDAVSKAYLAWEFEATSFERDVRFRTRSAGDVLSSVKSLATTAQDERLTDMAVTTAGRAFVTIDQDQISSADTDVTVGVVEAAGGSTLFPISNTSAQDSLDGMVVVDTTGTAHLLWLESIGAFEDIFYSSGK